MLTIGQVSRIFNISPKTLRHYDSVGLFIPSSIGDSNQYRYYALEQLPELRKIILLRSVGISIEVIRALRDSGAIQDVETLKRILEEQATNLTKEIGTLKQTLYNIESLVARISKTGEIDREVKLVTRTAFNVVGMIWDRSKGDIPALWEQFLLRKEELQNIENARTAFGIAIHQSDQEFTYIAGIETDLQQIPEGMTSITVPEENYAVFTHIGAVSGIGETIEMIYTVGLDQQGLSPKLGIEFELYNSKFLGPDNENSEIEIFIPIII